MSQRHLQLPIAASEDGKLCSGHVALLEDWIPPPARSFQQLMFTAVRTDLLHYVPM